MTFDPNSGVDTGWLAHYYEVDESQYKPREFKRPKDCGHNGKCVWDICPKCHKMSLHKYMGMAPKTLRVVDTERCENPGCGYLTTKKLMGR